MMMLIGKFRASQHTNNGGKVFHLIFEDTKIFSFVYLLFELSLYLKNSLQKNDFF